MFSRDDNQTHRVESDDEPEQRRSSFGVRAAILAGLVVATTGGVAAVEFTEDPVRMIAETHSTCCPPITER
ncbi:hypothetical protein Vqi01_50550 [Micromonospora qiuiae]|uniref:Uncharacterized protein n=1 Tax=Micromonospora qiuiae TaxID=502268 RepID=A0ABQ4JGZ3_9ACTN|nr:hypothetical protein [Micromonospora qiuiae]GIJ29893.1 hypothetical protein Vqi01_50550 [Micromonospora qiuiae]